MLLKIKSIAKFIVKNKIILIILLIAVCLRFVGLKPGYSSTHPDEWGYGSAIMMVYNKNLDPLRYDYPSGVALVDYIFFKFFFIPIYWLKFFINNIGPIIDGMIKFPLSDTEYRRIFLFNIVGQREINTLFWGRSITALFGVGVVFLTYLLGNKFFGKVAGLAASLFVAVNFRQVLNSHIGLPDIYNAFFLLLSLLVSLRLWKNPSKKNYITTAFVAGISFSIKYQVYSLIPLALVHLALSVRPKKWKDKLKSLFNSRFLITPFAFLLVVLLINPYHLVRWDEMVAILTYVKSKYGFGVNVLNLYPISYLYQYGVGKAMSFLVVAGLFYGLIKYFWKSIFLLSVIFPFFLTFVYLSRGGFYTRNFITIIPLCLIFAGLGLQAINAMIDKIFKKKVIVYLITFLLIVAVSWSNIEKSLIITKAYSKDWNFNILSAWVEKNIPKASRVAAHINVPLPVEDVERIFYDPEHSFSIDEFREKGADYAITHLDWATSGFYWWMGAKPKIFWKYYWNKPLDILEYSYPAIALRELQNFMVYSVLNPWQAPDTDYLVAKIPKYKVLSREKEISYDFEKDLDGWSKEGKYWVTEDGLDWRDGSLIVKNEPAMLPSIRWQSLPIETKGWSATVVEFKTKTESKLENLKTGYVFLNFYKNVEDAKLSKNRIGVRLSKRNSLEGEWVNINLVSQVPTNAEFMTIGFSSYNPVGSITKLDSLAVFKAGIITDFGGVTVTPFEIDHNNLFPVSHGNL